MDELLDRLEFSFKCKFSHYIVKVSQVKGSFYVLKKKPRGKILKDNLKYFFDQVEYISEGIYRKLAEYFKEFSYNFFPYFKLVQCYNNYQYHFLVFKKDYQYE